MKYISIDIETTGLDPERHQILEIAAVLDDLEGETHSDVFHVFVKHEEICGSIQALVMNAEIFPKITKCADDVLRPQDVTNAFRYWLERVGIDKSRDKIVFAGKNVKGFDLRFLNKLPLWDVLIHTHHRSLDPAILYMYPSDKEPPSLAECVERAVKYGTLKARPQHRALDDALTVIDLIRHHYFHGQI